MNLEQKVDEVLKRLQVVEEKTDSLSALVAEVKGAWIFGKYIVGFVGFVITTWAFVKDLIHHGN